MPADAQIPADQPISTRQRARRIAKRALMLLWVVAALFVFASAFTLTLRGGDVGAAPLAQSAGAVLVFVVLISFACEYVDSSIGMGYGTTLTPMLLLLGFAPAVVVPAVLMQELVSGSVNAFSHHRLGNADLRLRGRALRMALLLGGCGLIGGAVAARVAVALPADWVKLVAGIIVAAMGLVVAAGGRFRLRFSWARAGVLGLVAAINKGFMGGGYGPIVSSGQIVTGIRAREAVAITSLSECITCVGALTGYMTGGTALPWGMAAGLIAGGALASVLGAATVRVIGEERLRWAVAAGCLLLGGLTLVKALL
ncbi:MAG: sulfite exporter TauE/SafE family protein [Armatimonadota bacterium]